MVEVVSSLTQQTSPSHAIVTPLIPSARRISTWIEVPWRMLPQDQLQMTQTFVFADHCHWLAQPITFMILPQNPACASLRNVLQITSGIQPHARAFVLTKSNATQVITGTLSNADADANQGRRTAQIQRKV